MIYNISAPQYTPAFSLFTMPSLVIKRIFSVRNGKQEQPASPMTNANGTVSRVLPTFDELPRFQEFNGCAWEVWGKDDQLGTINLLTEDVVQRAAREEIRCAVVTMAFAVNRLLTMFGIMLFWVVWTAPGGRSR